MYDNDSFFVFSFAEKITRAFDEIEEEEAKKPGYSSKHK
jgi:hypothetical protein